MFTGRHFWNRYIVQYGLKYSSKYGILIYNIMVTGRKLGQMILRETGRHEARPVMC